MEQSTTILDLHNNTAEQQNMLQKPTNANNKK